MMFVRPFNFNKVIFRPNLVSTTKPNKVNNYLLKANNRLLLQCKTCWEKTVLYSASLHTV